MVIRKHPLLCIHHVGHWSLVFASRTVLELKSGCSRQRRSLLNGGPAAGPRTDRTCGYRPYFPGNGAGPCRRSSGATCPRPKHAGCLSEGDAGQFSALLTSGYAHMRFTMHRLQAVVLESARQTALCGRLFLGIVESTFHLRALHKARDGCVTPPTFAGRGRQISQPCWTTPRKIYLRLVAWILRWAACSWSRINDRSEKTPSGWPGPAWKRNEPLLPDDGLRGIGSLL